jgi:ribbon-helix-helix CopG family protein
MRTTVRIDDDLMRELKERAHGEGTSLTKLINSALRDGMKKRRGTGRAIRPFREKTFRMGEPTVNLDKSLALAASLEDEEVRAELARRK